MTLSPVEQRVLGALIEKEITTPENYPLSLNSLQAAANQRSSRDPVLDLAEDEIRSALNRLRDLGLVAPVHDARVPKWEHHARTVLQLRRDETAVLCLLLLRGPQTPGELRSRADRLYAFTDLDAVVGTLDRLAARSAAEAVADGGPVSGPLTAVLSRQPGAREARYIHLLGAAATVPDHPGSRTQPAAAGPAPDTLTALEDKLLHRIAALEARVARLETRRPSPESDEVQSGRSAPSAALP